MPSGFYLSARPDRIELNLLGAGDNDSASLVRFYQAPGAAAVVMGRLLYRRETLNSISSRISPELASDCTANDAGLALAAWLAHGREGLAKLEGDFCAVIWDEGRKQVLGCRDPMGAYPLFWAWHENALTIGTTMRSMVQGSARQSLNMDYFAEYLMIAAGNPEEVDSEKCAFQDVNRVRPGSIVQANLVTKEAEQETFWNWQQSLHPPQGKSLQEIAQEFLHLLRDAIRERMLGTTAAHLSGGMDSTTVALIAGQLASSGLAPGPVRAMSYVYETMHILIQERTFIDDALKGQQGLVSHLLGGDSLLDFDAFTDPPLFDEPCTWLQRWQVTQTMLDAGARLNVQTMMTGNGADHLVDVAPYDLADRLRRGRWVSAWNEAGRWARATNRSRWKILRQFGIENAKPSWMIGGLRAMFAGGYAPVSRQRYCTIPPWIDRTFAKRHDLRGIGIRNTRRIRRGHGASALSLALYGIESARGDLSRYWAAAPRQIHQAHPFFDPRLISFALGIPREISSVPGAPKIVLAEATRGILPESIRNRKIKGHFGELYYLGLARRQAELSDLIEQTATGEMKIFNRDVLLDCLAQAAAGIIAGEASVRLNRTLALLSWLSHLEQWEKHSLEATRTICLNENTTASVASA